MPKFALTICPNTTKKNVTQNYEAFRIFTELMRIGLPNDLTNMLQSLCNSGTSSKSGESIENEITEPFSPPEAIRWIVCYQPGLSV